MKKLTFFLMLLLGAFTTNAQFIETELTDIPVNDLEYDSFTGMVYGSIPASYGPDGNSIGVFNPMNQTLEYTIPVGPNPNDIDLSDDGTHLWVALEGNGHIARIRLSDNTVDLDFSLGANEDGELLFPAEISVMPGTNSTIAVSLKEGDGGSPEYAGTVIYDNAIKRTEMETSHTGLNTLTFGDDPETLWGYNNESSGFELFACEIDVSGIAETEEYEDYISGFNQSISYHNGRLYSTRGNIIDISSGSPELVANIDIGFYAAVTVDESAGLIVYAYDDVHEEGIIRFDIETFTVFDLMPVATALGEVDDIVNCGPNSYIITTDEDQVIFIYPEDLGFEQSVDNFEFSVYPNPTNSEFQISEVDMVNIRHIQILDLTGQVVETFSGNETTFNVADLPSGTYFIRVTTGKVSYVEQFIKL